MRFSSRRIRNTAVTVLALIALAMWLQRLDHRLMSTSYPTGYLLWFSVLFLTLYNVRKRLPFLPLGNSSTWLQVHLYLGCATLPLLGWHMTWRVPNGWLESATGATFILTWLSGLGGLYLTRRIPRQITQIGRETLAEEIPGATAQVRSRAYSIAQLARQRSVHSVLPEFYLQHLFRFFERRRSLVYLTVPTSRKRRQLQHELGALTRYLDHNDLPLRDQLLDLVQKKDDLDFQSAKQAMLRVWFFLHIALTIVLLVLGTLHGILALAFRGGLS